MYIISYKFLFERIKNFQYSDLSRRWGYLHLYTGLTNDL